LENGLQVNDVVFINYHFVSTKSRRFKQPVLAPRALSSDTLSYGFVVETRVLQTCSHLPDASNTIQLQLSEKLE